MTRLVLTVSFICSFWPAFSQQQIRILANYQDVPWQQVVEDLERRYPVEFYFAEDWMDGFKVSMVSDDLSIQQFLTNIFRATNFNYYIVGSQIIITQNYQLIDHWPTERLSETDNLKLLSPIIGIDPEAGNLETKLLYTVGDPQQRFFQGDASVSGYVTDAASGEPLVGVSVYLTETGKGTTTNSFGYYTLSIPKGDWELSFKSVGMKDITAQLQVYSTGQLNIEMVEAVLSLSEVVISDEKDNVESVQTGIAKLNIKELKYIPTALGEVDVMKIALTLPGVQTVGEGAAGFNVRGGNTDQNLVLLNNTVIYNPSHLFGFFSVFNPDVVRSAEIYKSGMQAQYGGRVSSIFDVSIRDGNKKKMTVTGGISPITGRIAVEGPIKKDTSSFIVGVRSTYSDYILNLLDDFEFSNSSASFSDFVGKVTHQANSNNTFSASFYHSRDRFRLNSDTVYSYFNTGGSLQWRHVFSNKFFGQFSATYTNYDFQIESDINPSRSFDLDYQINQGGLNADFDFLLSAKHNLKFGAALTSYHLQPGSITPGIDSNIEPIDIDKEQGLESALYIGDEFVASPKLTLYGGLRLSNFSRFGPEEVYSYDPNFSRDISLIIDTVSYDNGELVESYTGLEYRFSMRYLLQPDLSLKLSVDNTRQNIHLLTNTTSIAPTDVWRLSSSFIRPQIGTQYSAGIYRSFYQDGLEISIEAYYKRVNNLLEYKSGADLIVNEVLEADIINAKGRSYGVEFLIRKRAGRLTGWLGYTYSRSEVQAVGEFPEEQVNGGQYYPSNFDQPHNASLVSNYKVNRRINFSINAVYHTGRPITLPFTEYEFNGNVLPFFTERNQFRIPDYLRFDIAINLEGNHRVDKPAHGSWSFSVYNVLGRNNAFSVFFEGGPQGIEVYQLSIFSQPIPTITYKFSF